MHKAAAVCCVAGRSTINRGSSVLPTATPTSNRTSVAALLVFVWPELTLYHLNHFISYPAQPGRDSEASSLLLALLGLMLLVGVRGAAGY